MSSPIVSKLSKAALAGLLLVSAVTVTGCVDEVAVRGPAVGVYGYPPDSYIAMNAPVYYEGRPAYYYGNRWYYRDGARWGVYGTEPAYLRGYRGYGYGYAGGARYSVRGGSYRGRR